MIWSCISLCWVLIRCLSCDELVEMMCSSHLTLDPSDFACLLACLTFIFQFNTKLKLMVGWIPLNLEPTDQPTATSSFSSSLPSLTHITSFFISTNSPPHRKQEHTKEAVHTTTSSPSPKNSSPQAPSTTLVPSPSTFAEWKRFTNHTTGGTFL